MQGDVVIRDDEPCSFRQSRVPSAGSAAQADEFEALRERPEGISVWVASAVDISKVLVKIAIVRETVAAMGKFFRSVLRSSGLQDAQNTAAGGNSFAGGPGYPLLEETI